jgi:PhzF family phenazine biosynthesis protein
VPAVFDDADEDVDRALGRPGWGRDELDRSLPPRIAYAGARHLILAANTRDRLARLDYDFDGLKSHMLGLDLTTVALVWRESGDRFHARNPFRVGGVVEDPATGAAAAAFGAYLREIGAVTAPARVWILHGQDMGRASELRVDIDDSGPEIRVTGTAVAIPPESGLPSLPRSTADRAGPHPGRQLEGMVISLGRWAARSLSRPRDPRSASTRSFWAPSPVATC